MKHLNKQSNREGEVAIWWYTDERNFWAYSVPEKEAPVCGIYKQASLNLNHMNLWRDMINNYATPEEKEKYGKLPYECVERGRVIFDCQTMSFIVLCSHNLINDIQFQKDCLNTFHLPANTNFTVKDHYIKVELTGNPALDDFMLNFKG